MALGASLVATLLGLSLLEASPEAVQLTVRLSPQDRMLRSLRAARTRSCSSLAHTELTDLRTPHAWLFHCFKKALSR